MKMSSYTSSEFTQNMRPLSETQLHLNADRMENTEYTFNGVFSLWLFSTCALHFCFGLRNVKLVACCTTSLSERRAIRKIGPETSQWVAWMGIDCVEFMWMKTPWEQRFPDILNRLEFDTMDECVPNRPSRIDCVRSIGNLRYPFIDIFTHTVLPKKKNKTFKDYAFERKWDGR